jgi:hypothetical protein
MKCPIKLWSVGSACAAALLACQSADATVVFNNTTGDLLERFNPALVEIGDEIVLAGTARVATNFVFQYYGENFSGDEVARVRFYQNDGFPSSGVPSPGLVFYDSGPFSISATPRSTIAFDFTTLKAGNKFNPGQSFTLPNSFTWTVQFYNPDGNAGYQAGVDLYNPPTAGWDYNSYWDNDPLNGWLLKTNASYAMNFGARLEAVVPEPNTIVLGLGGALLVLLFRAGLRRS